MRITNAHEPTFLMPAVDLAPFVDGLGSQNDRLWPRRRWPSMILEDGLEEGSTGGHGPIRYFVESYVPGRAVTFRFTTPRGWQGTRELAVHALPGGGSRLAHVLEMDAGGMGLVLWISVFRPLHDALMEDALLGVARELGVPCDPPAWSVRVRILRWMLRPRNRRRGRT